MQYEVTLFETIERKIVIDAQDMHEASQQAQALYLTNPERFTTGDGDEGQELAPYVREN